MARRGSRTHHTHAIRNNDAAKFERWEADSQWPNKARSLSGETWCGERHGYNTLSDYKDESEDVFAYSRRMTNCPGCSAAIGKALIKRMPGRILLEKAEVRPGRYGSYYRTAWLIKIDGVEYGHAVMQNGWGNPWELKDLVGPDHISGAEFGRTVSHQPSTHYPAKPGDLWQNIHFASKEMMAVAALRCRERGEALFTVEERMAFAKAEKEKRAADEAEREANRIKYQQERERKDGLKAERKELALDWLNAVLAQPDLTNSQRAGAQACHDIITGKDVQ